MRRGRVGIRVRATVAATGIVAVALTGGGLLLVLLVHRALVGGVDAANLARARDVAALAGGVRPLPRTITSTGEETSVVQVLDASGVVVAASPNVTGEPAMLGAVPRRRTMQVLTRTDLAIGDPQQPFRVVALPVRLAGDADGWVYVATSLRSVDVAVGRVEAIVGVGFPLLLVLVAVVTWGAVGRALRPVERMRSRAAEIGGGQLHERVPVPPTQDEIAGLARTLNEMLQRLEDAALRQQRFVGDASHELRSPLTALRTQVDVALAHPDPAAAGAVLQRVQRQAERMAELIDDLLFLARADEGAPRTTELVDLDELVLAEAQRLRALGQAHVEVVGLQAVRVRGSARDLARMLRNLGDNAAEHCSQRITLRVCQLDDAAVVSVSDDGPGVPASERDRIFERFARVEKSRARTKSGSGTGLGLAITAQIVHAHGGRIEVVDRPEGPPGAQFVVRIPVAPDT